MNTNHTQHTRPASIEDRVINLRQCKLVVIKGSKRGESYNLVGDVIRIGKADSNDIVLPEDTISREHCEILNDGRGYLLKDLGSTNGTFLDGAEVREAYIRSGSVITVGTVQLKFQPFEERIELLPSEADRLGDMVGSSLAIREIFGLIERVAPTEATILIEGETGTGKDLVARTIHDYSPRKDAPFIIVDCGSVAPSLVESELFGHEKGAFTGATSMRQGAFELANGGTLFLDELGELPLDLQPKLLRALEQREIRRVGGNRTIRVDIRVVAATKQDLKAQIEQGKFREDLYFRLAVVPMYMPALRERPEDIPLMVREFTKKYSDVDNYEIPQQSLDVMVAHDWPGNVRELRNVVERGVYLSQELGHKSFQLDGFGSPINTPSHIARDSEFDPELSYRANKERWNDDFELRYLKWLLGRADGNVSKAAREAEMDRKYLHKLIKKHNLQN